MTAELVQVRGDDRAVGANLAALPLPRVEPRALQCSGLVVAANRQNRMAIVRVDASGSYSVIRWSAGSGPRVGGQLVGELEQIGAGPLLDDATGTDVNVMVVAHHYPLKEAIEAID